MTDYRATTTDGIRLSNGGNERTAGSRRYGLRTPPDERVALTKQTPPSIPSRYMTYHFDTNESRGFNTSSRRFFGPVNELPGPGFYYNPGSFVRESASISRKGLGGFASKSTFRDKLPTDLQSTNIGPGQYELGISTCTEKKPSSAFCPPIAKYVQKKSSPGPAEYEIFEQHAHQTSVTSFKSRTQRDSMVCADMPGRDAPAPGYYTVHDEVLYPTAAGAIASFRTTKRPEIIPKGREKDPGPASYSIEPHIVHFKPARKPIGSVAVKPKINFAPKPTPGPGSYDVAQAAQNVLPHSPAAYQAGFKSLSSRLRLPCDPEIPGPAVYRPRSANAKTMFRLNISEKWVC